MFRRSKVRRLCAGGAMLPGLFAAGTRPFPEKRRVPRRRRTARSLAELPPSSHTADDRCGGAHEMLREPSRNPHNASASQAPSQKSTRQFADALGAGPSAPVGSVQACAPRRSNPYVNWKPRLFSLVGHESLVDWMSYHHNEKDEWLRFGAAIYLADVRHGEIHDNVVERQPLPRGSVCGISGS